MKRKHLDTDGEDVEYHAEKSTQSMIVSVVIFFTGGCISPIVVVRPSGAILTQGYIFGQPVCLGYSIAASRSVR